MCGTRKECYHRSRDFLVYHRGVSYQFGSFTLDPATRRLLNGDAEIHLSTKAFDLLKILIDERARAVPRQELHERLWPETYVLETNLASLVAEVRRALQDSADDPQFVRTVHRVGYWFIGGPPAASKRLAPATPAGQYWLVWETRQVALCDGENIVGRAPDAAIWIDAAGVSRHHARIVVGAEPTIEDLGSKNGTFLRGRPISQPQILVDGDDIRLGSVVVTFRIPAPAGSTETVPS
jgi:DNA-binding winged helix-turn-helix (wHTH) protein